MRITFFRWSCKIDRSWVSFHQMALKYKTNLWRNRECKHNLGRSRIIIADLNHGIHALWKSSLNHTNVIAPRIVRMQLHCKHEKQKFFLPPLFPSPFLKECRYTFTLYPLIFYISSICPTLFVQIISLYYTLNALLKRCRKHQVQQCRLVDTNY